MEWGRMRDTIEQPERWVVGLCLLVILALLAIEATGLAATLRTPAPAIAPASSASATTDYASQVSSANLFGRAPTAGNDQSLPQTQLNVTLRGVFTSDDPALASAIIESEDGKMQMVRTGATLGDNTTLERVYPNRVVVSRSGIMENLYFPTTGSGAEIETPTPVMEAPPAAASDLPEDDEERKANILRRLEELRSRGALSQ